MKNYTFKISQELIEKVRENIAGTEVSIGAFIRDAIREKLTGNLQKIKNAIQYGDCRKEELQKILSEK